MQSFKRLIGQEEEEKTLMGELSEMVSLTFKQRIMGFGICLGVGILFCFMSIFFLGTIALNPSGFAVPYTLGNIFALASTGFLVGPMKQLKMMFKPVRIVATLLYLGSMAFTLWAAFGLHSASRWILVLLAIVVQFCAIVWYCLSYIPYARACVKNVVSGTISV